MTDISYFSEFLATLFNISHDDYTVEKVSSNVDITEATMAMGEGETIEDIEHEIAEIMKEVSERNGSSKGAGKDRQLKPLHISVVHVEDSQTVLMVDLFKESRTGVQSKTINAMGCQVYVAGPQHQADITRNHYNENKDEHKSSIGVSQIDKTIKKRKNIQLESSGQSLIERLARDIVSSVVQVSDAKGNPSSSSRTLSNISPQSPSITSSTGPTLLVPTTSASLVGRDFGSSSDSDSSNDHGVVTLEETGIDNNAAIPKPDTSRVAKYKTSSPRGETGGGNKVGQKVSKSRPGKHNADSAGLNNHNLCDDIKDRNIIKKCFVGLKKLDLKELESTLVENKSCRRKVTCTKIDTSSRRKDAYSHDNEVNEDSDDDICEVISYSQDQVGMFKKCWVGVSKLDPVKVKLLLKNNEDETGDSIQTTLESHETDVLINVDSTDNQIFPSVSSKEGSKGEFVEDATEYPEENLATMIEEGDRENVHDMMILDELQEESETGDTFDEKDFSNFLQYCKDDDRAQVQAQICEEASPLVKKKQPTLKNKLKKVAKTILKKIKIPKSSRVKTKDATSSSLSFYSGNLVKDFLPVQPKKKEVSLYKIPKLPPTCQTLNEESRRNEKVVEGRDSVTAKKSIIDQMVMVDKERVTLGTFLKKEGIIPGMDMRKLMIPDGVTTEDGSILPVLVKGEVEETRVVQKLLPMDKEELDDINHNKWEVIKKISTDEERHQLSRRAFKNPVPANPSNNLTFHGYRGKVIDNEGERSHGHHYYREPTFPMGSVTIRQGMLEPLPGYKRKHREYDVARGKEKRRKMEFKNFTLYMKSLYFEKYKSKVEGEETSKRRFRDFQYFIKHVKNGQEETENFLSFYSNKVLFKLVIF